MPNLWHTRSILVQGHCIRTRKRFALCDLFQISVVGDDSICITGCFWPYGTRTNDGLDIAHEQACIFEWRYSHSRSSRTCSTALSRGTVRQTIPLLSPLLFLISIDNLKTSAIYQRMDYSIADIEEAAGGPIALSEDKAQVLMGCMREPALSIHGIEGAFSGPGAKTVIPAKVSGKFSIR
jgi:hypothetical protein